MAAETQTRRCPTCGRLTSEKRCPGLSCQGHPVVDTEPVVVLPVARAEALIALEAASATIVKQNRLKVQHGIGSKADIDLEKALRDAALASGDVIAMVAALTALRGCE